jgi:MFS family permease
MSNPSAPPLQPEFQKEIERDYRHNFIFNALDGATFWFGYSFISPAIILPLYVSHFTTNPILIGLLPFFNTAGVLIPQLFISNFVERAPRKKVFPVIVGFFSERIPIFALPFTAYFLAINKPALALSLFFILYAWHTIGAGFILVGWQDMIAKIIPVNRRGRFFGITNFAGTASGTLGALAVAWVLEHYEFPQGFVFSFSAAAILVLISWFFISQTREPAVHTRKPRLSQLDYLRSLPRIIRSDRNFRRYMAFQLLYTFSQMASGFLVVYAAQKWNLPDSQAGSYIIALQLGQSLANLYFGFLSDRKGHKLTLELSVLASAGSLLLAILAPGPLWIYPVFFLRGAMSAGNMMSGSSIVMEFAKPEDRPTYIGLANTVPGVVAGMAPIFAGWLAGASGYPSMFILATAAALFSFGMLRWSVREPRFYTAYQAGENTVS